MKPLWVGRIRFNIRFTARGSREVNLAGDCVASYTIFKWPWGHPLALLPLANLEESLQKLDYGVPRGTGLVYPTRKGLVSCPASLSTGQLADSP